MLISNVGVNPAAYLNNHSVENSSQTASQSVSAMQKLASFLGMEDAILYSSCFDANGGLFETLLGAEHAIISDALN
ncbi:hypothetical protein MJM45_28765, partial [Salmonella enterica subsp. enterica serovar Kentucky]|nr:hypothetical protein [Salmonella enterica subsp. enterica serovar Kentucky]